MPPTATPGTERHALVRSIAATAFLAAVGVVWGIAVGSQMILFDGAYAVIGIGLSWLLLKASALAASGPTHHYPFGRDHATPLVIGVQGVVLLGTLVYAAVEGVYTIAGGGSEIEVAWAFAYGVVTTVASIAATRWLQQVASGSDLVAAEATAWRVAALRGVGMTVGFAAMWMLESSRWDGVAPYVDPGMVIVTCVLFLPTPVRMVRATIVELLEGAPPEHVVTPVREAVDDVTRSLALAAPTARVAKVGRRLYVEVEVPVDPDVTVSDEERARAILRQRLDDLPYDVWLTFEMRTTPALDGHAPSPGTTYDG